MTSRENTAAKNGKKKLKKKNSRKKLFSAPIHWQLAYNVAGINGKLRLDLGTSPQEKTSLMEDLPRPKQQSLNDCEEVPLQLAN